MRVTRGLNNRNFSLRKCAGCGCLMSFVALEEASRGRGSVSLRIKACAGEVRAAQVWDHQEQAPSGLGAFSLLQNSASASERGAGPGGLRALHQCRVHAAVLVPEITDKGRLDLSQVPLSPKAVAAQLLLPATLLLEGHQLMVCPRLPPSLLPW